MLWIYGQLCLFVYMFVCFYIKIYLEQLDPSFPFKKSINATNSRCNDLSRFSFGIARYCLVLHGIAFVINRATHKLYGSKQVHLQLHNPKTYHQRIFNWLQKSAFKLSIVSVPNSARCQQSVEIWSSISRRLPGKQLRAFWPPAPCLSDQFETKPRQQATSNLQLQLPFWDSVELALLNHHGFWVGLGGKRAPERHDPF